MALEVRLGQELRLRQQLVMTPQLQQAIKILQLALPDLEAVVQSELEQNPMLEPLDRSTGEVAANDDPGDNTSADPAEAADAGPGSDDFKGLANEVETPSQLDAAARDNTDAATEIRELGSVDKMDWREYLENYSNN